MQEMQETWVWYLGWEDPLEEGMATHSCILAQRIPRIEGTGRQQSTGSQRVGHDWACMRAHIYVWEVIPGDTSWRVSKWKREGKKKREPVKDVSVMQVPLWATQVLWLLGNPRSQSTFCASGWPTSGYKYPGSHQSLVECCLWGMLIPQDF